MENKYMSPVTNIKAFCIRSESIFLTKVWIQTIRLFSFSAAAFGCLNINRGKYIPRNDIYLSLYSQFRKTS